MLWLYIQFMAAGQFWLYQFLELCRYNVSKALLHCLSGLDTFERPDLFLWTWGPQACQISGLHRATFLHSEIWFIHRITGLSTFLGQPCRSFVPGLDTLERPALLTGPVPPGVLIIVGLGLPIVPCFVVVAVA